MKSSMTRSDTQRDDYIPCEDSMWQLKKTKYKHMKRILSTLKEKRPEYFFEILVLIIGIYEAFELSNYGDDQARKRAKIEILRPFRQGMDKTFCLITNSITVPLGI